MNGWRPRAAACRQTICGGPRASLGSDVRPMRGADNAGRRMCVTGSARMTPLAATSGAGGGEIGPAWRLVGGDGLGIAVTDDGERIARDRAAGNDWRDAQQNGVQRNRADRCPAHYSFDAQAHNTQFSSSDRVKPTTGQNSWTSKLFQARAEDYLASRQFRNVRHRFGSRTISEVAARLARGLDVNPSGPRRHCSAA